MSNANQSKPASSPANARVDWVIHARWIATVDDANTVLENHALVVKNSNIIELLPSADAEQNYTGENTVNLDQHLVLPGLVNAHCHAAMALLRGFADDLPLQTWLEQHIWPTEGRHVAPQFVYDGSLIAIAEMIRSGTTCFADMYFFPEQTAQAATEVGMRAHLAPPVFDFPSNWQTGPEQYLSAIAQLSENQASNPLLSTAIGPHAPYTVSDDTFKQITAAQKQLDCGLHIHVHETAQEVIDSQSQHGLRPLARLAQLGALGPKTQCVHMTQINDADLEALHQWQPSVVHCPKSNMKLASGFCPVHKLIEEGINVALGTDGAASNNNLDMISEMQFAALLAKPVSGKATAISAQQALRMATINGAKALGLDGLIGSLEKGKQADITAIRLDHLSQAPVYSPLSALVYASSGRQVTDVWIAGEQQLAAGQLIKLATDELRARQQRWLNVIAGDAQ
ncbi:TRZ/ATZ family hydrolase [Halioxenophilus aromaticivorans]|uniref:TRZ/ATZ family hydrolase n=1 Tax=Halioxenophilus aromaticivorans TaxID=1306992 RepID=A0AAV3U006_9ALTE